MSKTPLCTHGYPLFQTCYTCNRIMVHDAFCGKRIGNLCTCNPKYKLARYKVK